MSSTTSGLVPIRQSIREIIVEEELFNEKESSESESDDIDVQTVNSEIEKKFNDLARQAKVDSKISRIIDDEAAEAVIV